MNTQERLVKKFKAMYDEVQILRNRVAELEAEVKRLTDRGWHDVSDLYEENPENQGDQTVTPTPKCDEPGCSGIAEFIVSTPTGYRWSCAKHQYTKDVAKLESIDDDAPCCDGNPTPPETQ